MSAYVSGTRGSGVLSSTGDVLVRGVGGVCDMYWLNGSLLHAASRHPAPRGPSTNR